MTNNHKHLISTLILCFTVFIGVPAMALETVDTGITPLLTIDNGGRDCRMKDWHVPCGSALDWIPDILGVNPWVAFLPVPGIEEPLEDIQYWKIRTIYSTLDRLVGAAFTNLGYLNASSINQFGTPHYANSWLYTDIDIADPNDNQSLVDALIATTYTWEGGIAGAGNYEGRISLSIEVEDITGAEPKGVGSFELVSRDRSGDQGVTDVASGAISYDRDNNSYETSHFTIKLQRGNTYRIYFKAEAFAAPLLTAIESSIRAKLERFDIAISNDVNTQLEDHDTDIKEGLDAITSQISTHDSNISTAIYNHDEKIDNALYTHDQDIKQLAKQIQSDLVEIKRLLNTPQGRRSEFPLKK